MFYLSAEEKDVLDFLKLFEFKLKGKLYLPLLTCWPNSIYYGFPNWDSVK